MCTCPSCSTSTTILTVILIATLTALFFVAVLVVVHKCQLKSRSGGNGTGISAEEDHEQMDGNEEGVTGTEVFTEGGEEDYEQVAGNEEGVTGTEVFAEGGEEDYGNEEGVTGTEVFAEGGEEDYDQTDGDEIYVIESFSRKGVRSKGGGQGGVAMRRGGEDPTYMEIGEQSFQLKENEAYHYTSNV